MVFNYICVLVIIDYMCVADLILEQNALSIVIVRIHSCGWFWGQCRPSHSCDMHTIIIILTLVSP